MFLMIIVDSYIEFPFILNKTIVEEVRNEQTNAFLSGSRLTNMSLMILISTIDQNSMGVIHFIYGIFFTQTLKIEVEGLTKEASYMVIL